MTNTEAGPGINGPTWQQRLKSAPKRLSLGRYTGVIFGLLAVCVYMSLTEPAFLTVNNWENILRSEAVVLMLAIGMTFVVLTGGIDLSVGSVTAASAVALGVAIDHGATWWVGCLAAVGAGLALGMINGLLIGIAKIPFFVVTLGTLSIYQSLALLGTPTDKRSRSSRSQNSSGSRP